MSCNNQWDDPWQDERQPALYRIEDMVTPWNVRNHPSKYGAIVIPSGIVTIVATAGQNETVFRFENFGTTAIMLAAKTEYLGADVRLCVILEAEEIVVRTVKGMATIYAVAPNITSGILKVESRSVDPVHPHPLFVGLDIEPPGSQKGRREWKEPNE